MKPAAKGAYLEWLRDPEVVRFLESRFSQFDEDRLAHFIRSRNASENSILAGIFFERRHVGNIKLEFDVHHRRGELGLMIGDKAVWGRGIARRAIVTHQRIRFSGTAHHQAVCRMLRE